MGLLTQTLLQSPPSSIAFCSDSHCDQTDVLWVKEIKAPILATLSHNFRTEGSGKWIWHIDLQLLQKIYDGRLKKKECQHTYLSRTFSPNLNTGIKYEKRNHFRKGSNSKIFFTISKGAARMMLPFSGVNKRFQKQLFPSEVIVQHS